MRTCPLLGRSAEAALQAAGKFSAVTVGAQADIANSRPRNLPFCPIAHPEPFPPFLLMPTASFKTCDGGQDHPESDEPSLDCGSILATGGATPTFSAALQAALIPPADVAHAASVLLSSTDMSTLIGGFLGAGTGAGGGGGGGGGGPAHAQLWRPSQAQRGAVQSACVPTAEQLVPNTAEAIVCSALPQARAPACPGSQGPVAVVWLCARLQVAPLLVETCRMFWVPTLYCLHAPCMGSCGLPAGTFRMRKRSLATPSQ